MLYVKARALGVGRPRARGACRVEFRIGRYLVEDGAITRNELQTVLEQSRGAPKRPARRSCWSRLAMVTEEQVRRALGAPKPPSSVYEVVR